jgi:1,4-alpha-glucan branching enzyme
MQHMEGGPRLSIGTMAPMVAPGAPTAPAAAPAQTAEQRTQQKIEEFYGVKQMGDEVMFSVKFDQAKKVALAGEFNGWSPLGTPMQVNGKPGVFTAKLPLPRGRYRYRIIVDGQWMTDPNNKYVETNEYGELNNVVEVD